MALGKYTRVDNRRSSSSYCSTVTIVVFVALCLVGVWMMTSSSVVPVQNVDVPEENKSEVKKHESRSEVTEQVSETNVNNENNESNVNNENNESNEGNTKQFEDNKGDLPEDATKGDGNGSDNNQEEEKPKGKPEENTEEKPEGKPEEKNEEKPEDGGNQTEEGDSKVENSETNSEGGGNDDDKSDSDENQKKSDTDDNDKKPETTDETKDGEKIEEKVEQNDNKESDDGSGEKKENDQSKNQGSNEVFPSGAQSELLNETATQSTAWSTQAAESKNEKETQRSSNQNYVYNWKVCNTTAGFDFIPCLDNLKAIRSLPSTKHYEHRERHCPEEGPTCLVPLPEGYKRSIAWPTSREKVC